MVLIVRNHEKRVHRNKGLEYPANEILEPMLLCETTLENEQLESSTDDESNTDEAHDKQVENNAVNENQEKNNLQYLELKPESQIEELENNGLKIVDPKSQEQQNEQMESDFSSKGKAIF